MKTTLDRHLSDPPTWYMLLLMGLVLLLLTAGIFWHQWLLRFVALPEVDWNQTGIKVFHYAEPGFAGDHHRREYYSDVEFHMEKPHSSAFGVGVMRLEEPAQLHFLVESDDFGSLAVNGSKFVEQDPTTSALNQTPGKGRLKAGLHLVVIEANNGLERGWFRLKVRHDDSPEWSLLGDGVAIHPVTHPVFDSWLKAGEYVPKACLITAMLMTLGIGYAYRRWTYLDLFYSAVRRSCSLICWDGAWLAGKEHLLNDKKVQLFVFMLPFALLILLGGVKVWDQEIYRLLAWDDSLLEYIQFACYLAAALFALNVSFTAHKGGLTLHCLAYAILSAGLFFVSMEEISWGQRILEMESPDFFRKHNAQGELTLHNLEAVTPILHDAYIAVGLYGSLAWLILSRLNFHNSEHILKYCAPDWFLSPYFFILFIIYATHTYLIPDLVGHWRGPEHVAENFFHSWDQEVGELFLAMGFFLFSLTKYIRLRAFMGRPAAARA